MPIHSAGAVLTRRRLRTRGGAGRVGGPSGCAAYKEKPAATSSFLATVTSWGGPLARGGTASSPPFSVPHRRSTVRHLVADRRRPPQFSIQDATGAVARLRGAGARSST